MLFPEFKAGDPLTSAHMNAVFAELRRWSQLTGTGGIVVQYADSNSPPQIEDWRPPAGGQLCYTDTGGITARVTTTAGWGLVYPVTPSVTWSGSTPTCTLTTGSVALTVFNYSATVGGIPAGKYCWVAQDAGGLLWVVSAEC